MTKGIAATVQYATTELILSGVYGALLRENIFANPVVEAGAKEDDEYVSPPAGSFVFGASVGHKVASTEVIIALTHDFSYGIETIPGRLFGSS